jgi:predicted nucleic acid-binding protein
MSEPGVTPLFIDTGSFYARMDDRDDDDHQACAVFDAIEAGELAYRPLYTTGYVLGELVALTLARAHHALAATALERIRFSSRIQVLHPGAETFARV